MKYVLFDRSAIAALVSTNVFQSVEYVEGKRLIEHITQSSLPTEFLSGILVWHTANGVLVVGKGVHPSTSNETEIYCIDLLTCRITEEKPVDMLLVLQKSFRTATRIWERRPFTFSERIHGSKSILFPFVIPDQRRLVIERANDVPRLTRRGINYPLLAYKYNAEDAPKGEESIDVSRLRLAGEDYLENFGALQSELNTHLTSISRPSSTERVPAVAGIITGERVGNGGFSVLNYEMQYSMLTETQKRVVDYPDTSSPLRVEGAAGTGKTAALLMRAYSLLQKKKKEGQPFHIVFFSHSQSTHKRNMDNFAYYAESTQFLSEASAQNIHFATLLEYCCRITGISLDTIIERDAGDAKDYQLLLIEDVVARAKDRIRTLNPLLSEEMQRAFDETITSVSALCVMLQHEFSIQIKGRTDGTIEKYCDLSSIENGLPCRIKKDKELVFSIYKDYQSGLRDEGSFDIDDVVLEALSRFNGPVWRRKRVDEGYDYIIVDEMHLFNFNEQNSFHYLTKDLASKDIPICFALDYSQAIGDRGQKDADYIEGAFGSSVEKKKFHTVFRNSPQITEFCASVAASGTLMFQNAFENPYKSVSSNFDESEEQKSETPILHLYTSDETMVGSLKNHLEKLIKELQCKPCDIAIISFENSLLSQEEVDKLQKQTAKKFLLVTSNQSIQLSAKKQDAFIFASPYAINGLEFQAVILLGVDDGRIPQTVGVSDISKNFVWYSAYNLLYLASSRAKYRLVLLGNNLKGKSPCLKHSIETKNLKEINS